MFTYTSTTVINSAKDANGIDMWKLEGEKLFVNRNLTFKKENILDVNVTTATDGVPAVATLDLNGLGEGNYRIAMYIRLSPSASNSYFANDLVFQGKPLYIEFIWKAGESAAAVAANIVALASKHMLAVYEKSLVKIEAEGSVLTITALDEYQRFHKVAVEKYAKEANSPFGAYEVAKEGTITQGKEGFGTYQYILKNLRLPSSVRGAIGAVASDEAPVIGAKYDEVVIRYGANRGVMGTDAVGEVSKSVTTHIFYVNQTISAEFIEAVESLTTETEEI